MAGSPDEDIVSAHSILRFKDKGHIFEQSWATIPDQNAYAIELDRKDRSNQVILKEDDWRGIKKCCPIVSGGLNPTLLAEFIDLMEGMDFITTMGAGCNAHPWGTQAGATALVQACEAYTKKIDIHKYAKNHKELAEAIKFFSPKSK